ncbi:hypothetical protein N431DRAFT_430082 [Stipitochalara longipes BDJ]|nr:hypothetical protein N431DRAFT_430082 [Stipitochalara longipes BDJ]
MKLIQILLEVLIFFISIAAAQPTTPRGLLDLPNPFAPAPAPSTTAAAPAAPIQCRCTVVFGDKTSLTVNTAVGSTNGISGQATNKKACTATLLVGTGCSAAISSESVNNCVKSEACITA